MTPEMITKNNEKQVKGTAVAVKAPAAAASGLKAPALPPGKTAPLATSVTASAVSGKLAPAPGSPSNIMRKLTPESAVAPEVPSAIHLRREDAAAAWQSRPRMPSRLMDTYVNFMVLGEL